MDNQDMKSLNAALEENFPGRAPQLREKAIEQWRDFEGAIGGCGDVTGLAVKAYALLLVLNALLFVIKGETLFEGWVMGTLGVAMIAGLVLWGFFLLRAVRQRALDKTENRQHLVNVVIEELKELHMGDTFSANQVGVMGHGNQTGNVTLHQNNGTDLAKINLPQLAQELLQLRGEMKKAASEPEHDVAIGNVASAEAAASKGDVKGVASHLKSAGQWALDVATKIGTALAVEAIKHSLYPK